MSEEDFHVPDIGDTVYKLEGEALELDGPVAQGNALIWGMLIDLNKQALIDEFVVYVAMDIDRQNLSYKKVPKYQVDWSSGVVDAYWMNVKNW